MYMAVAGLPSEDAADVPDDLTEEKMVEVIKTYFSVSMNATREVVEDLLSQASYDTQTFWSDARSIIDVDRRKKQLLLFVAWVCSM